jgi:hypothetical protein
VVELLLGSPPCYTTLRDSTFALSGWSRGDCGHAGTSDPSRLELLDARLMTLPTKVIDGVLHYVYGRD